MKKTISAFLIVSILFSSCSMINSIFGGKKTLDWQGHRGARGLMPENTIPAMLKGIDLGVTTLEMDAAISSDMQLVVSHEPWFNPDITTNPDGTMMTEAQSKKTNLYRMPYSEIKKYDVGLRGNPNFPQQQKIAVYKPLLSELIDSVEHYTSEKNLPKVSYNIEIKTLPEGDNIYHPAPQKFADMLVALVTEKGIANRVIIQSFDQRALKAVHDKYPTMKTALLVEKMSNFSYRKHIFDLGFSPTIYSPQFELVSKPMIKGLHKMNIKLIPWTVNNQAKIDELIKMGVDGIITDYPNLKR